MNSRADAVFEALRRGVLEGKLLPGEHLRQETLSGEFGVSQITVRDALSRLITEGLAVRSPYKGVRVIELSRKDLEEAYSLRAMLEGWATELAASRITREALAQLRRLLPDTYVTIDPRSIEQARQANRAFHEIIIEASGNALLARMLKDIWNRVDPMTYYGRTLPTEHGEEIRREWGERDRLNHVALIKALEHKNGPRARQLVTEYTLEVWNVLAAALEAASATAEDAPRKPVLPTGGE
jgi:DNA-binding GntR family transcriptional regulator